jgi:hypothetical protein
MLSQRYSIIAGVVFRTLLLSSVFLFLSCGHDSYDRCSDIGLTAKVMSGTECGEIERSPVVRLELREDGDKKGYCSGSVITSTAILSAAHCVHDIDAVRVRVGGETIESKEFYKHPDSDIDDEYINDPGNDVAIIILPRPVNVAPLAILRSRIIEEGEEFSIFGYGVSEDDTDTDDLRSGRMDADEVESDYIESQYTDDSSSVCFGDSGGPATVRPVRDGDGPVAIVGVASAVSFPSIIDNPLVPGLPTQGVFPGPLPFPLMGDSCPDDTYTFHASVQTDSVKAFIDSHVSGVMYK